MNNEELNNKMAEVIGYRKGVNCWIDDVTKKGLYFKDWHPDTDIAQALMCADKAFGKGWTIHISFYTHKLQIFHGGRVVSLWEFEDMKGLSRAICEAIAEAVEK